MERVKTHLRYLCSRRAALVLALSTCAGSAVEFTSNACAAELAATTAQETSTATGALQTGEETSAAASTQQTATAATTPASVEYDSDDLEPSVVGTDTLYIVLAGDVITFEGEGATVDGSVVTITSGGTYRISGTLNDGQIIVDTQDEETVYLVLDGVDITCSTGAPIYVVNAANDGIKGRDSIAVLDGTITVIAGADGLHRPAMRTPKRATSPSRAAPSTSPPAWTVYRPRPTCWSAAAKSPLSRVEAASIAAAGAPGAVGA